VPVVGLLTREMQSCYSVFVLLQGALVCSEYQFSCGREGNVTRCIPNTQVCDGHLDCPSALDELHCKSICLHRFQFVLLVSSVCTVMGGVKFKLCLIQ